MLRQWTAAKKPECAKRSKTKEKGRLLFSATWNRDLVQYSPKAHHLLSVVGIARLQRQASLIYAAVATRRWWRTRSHTDRRSLTAYFFFLLFFFFFGLHSTGDNPIENNLSCPQKPFVSCHFPHSNCRFHCGFLEVQVVYRV